MDADTGTTGVQSSVDEDGGAKMVQVTATVNGTTRYAEAKTVSVAVGKTSDTATEGTDYTTVTDLSITINAGDQTGTATFTLTPTDDSLDEEAEKISLDGSSSGITVTDAEITINDDDAAPTGITLTVDADTGTTGVQSSVDEDGGAKMVQVTATVNGTTRYAEAKTVSVAVGKTSDTATEGTDYTTVTDLSITINAGDQTGTATFTLTPTDDSLDEEAEKISLDGSSSGITVTDAEITINDDDAAPTGITLTVDADTGTTGVQSSVDEDGGAKMVQVTATVNGTTRYAEAKTVSVAVGKTSDTATEGTDYTTVTDLSITINAGDQTGTATFTLTPTDDSLDEEAEKISLDGSSSGITVTDAEITINDDDAAPTGITLTVDADTGTTGVQSSVDEDGGAKMVQVTATVNGTTRYAEAKTVSVAVGKTSDTATEGTDYTTVTDLSITINAGDQTGTATFTLTPTDDSLDEEAEKISLDGSSSGITVTDAEITINDDDAAPTGITLTVDADTGTTGVQSSVDEDGGAKMVQVTATVNGTTRYAEAKTVSVAVGKTSDTATEGTDYTTVTDLSITINAGDQTGTATFTLTPTDDSLDEEAEKISLDGSSSGITVTDAEITINDDDAAPTGITLTVDADTGTTGVQSSVDEDGGAKMVQVTATVNGTTRYAEAKTVSVAVGKTSDTATEGTDYTTVTDLSITINAGDQTGTATFTLTPTDDSLDEEAEKISLDGSSSGITVTDAEITINDDDAAPTGITLTVDADTGTTGVQSSVDEDGGAKMVQVTATVNGTTRYAEAKTVSVAVGKTSDTATEGTDYTTVTDLSITINAGDQTGTATFTLTPTDDSLDEEAEKISLDGSSSGITVTDAEITINDDDAAPTGITLTVDADTGTTGVQSSVDEDGGAKMVQVTATVNGTTRYAEAKTVSVAVGKTSDTATEGTDYTTVTDLSITINAGDQTGTATFTLTPTDDSLDEEAEKISLDGSSSGITVTDAEITINDDDAAPTGICRRDVPSRLIFSSASSSESSVGVRVKVFVAVWSPALIVMLRSFTVE